MLFSREQEKYLTLREASKISGYSRDYLGRLIREQKIDGMRLVGTSAWVMTEETLLEYMRTNKSGRLQDRRDRAVKRLESELTERKWFGGVPRPLLWLESASYFLLVAVILFFAFLFYIYSVVLDKATESKTTESSWSSTSAEVTSTYER